MQERRKAVAIAAAPVAVVPAVIRAVIPVPAVVVAAADVASAAFRYCVVQ
jgi:hypothetical protein